MNIFNSVKQTRVPKSLFDLTHDVKLSANMGELIPVLNMPCVPGDHVHLSGETLVRLAPMLAPLMHRVDITIHYFFVPNRILWPNWEKFITGAELFPGSVEAAPALPVFDVFSASGQDPTFQRLADYLGVPPTATIPWSVGGPCYISALPFEAYARVWYEYYRDQNQQLPNSDPHQLSDGVNTIDLAQTQIKNRAWEHDYFTAALPWAQKGPDVRIPSSRPPGADSANPFAGTYISNGAGAVGAAGALNRDSDGQLTVGGQPAIVNNGTINDLRNAYKLQEWLEKNARGGTRYKESILAHYGVNTSDKRLQRPEYITGLKTPVVISQVLNTTGGPQGTADTAQGTMTGHGVAVTSGQAGSYFCEEHGYIMGIMSVLPKTAYQQGIPRDFIKYDYLEFGFPEFANLGEQFIDVNEIAAYSDTVAANLFGYIPRYSEYKFMHNRVAGDFRTSLNYWHMARIFTSPPGLDEAFVVSDPTTRIFAVTDPDVQHLWIQVLHHIKALRPFPKYGNPGW